MRTRICYPFILLIALLTTVSCENELPFSVKDNPPKLVMNALINADSLTNVLYLNFTGRGYATHVENATVEVRVNGQLSDLKSATKLFSVLLASKRPLITELADKLRLKYPLLPTISPCPTMRLEAIRSIIPISCRRYPKSV